MELDELHVFHRDASRVCHADAAAVVDQGVGRVEVNPAVAACCKKGRLRHDGDNFTFDLVDKDHAVAGAFLLRQPDGYVFVIDLDATRYRPLVKRVEEHVACQVCREAGPREACAAERALGYRAVREAAEGAAPMLHLIDDVDRFFAHDLDRVLVCEVIAPLYRVEGVLFPRVVFAVRIVCEGCVDAPLGRYGMGPYGVYFGYEGYVVLVAKADCCAQSGQATPDDNDIMLDHAMLLWRRAVSEPPK